MDLPLASSQLPSGWENLPETVLKQYLLNLPWQSIPKYCSSFKRINNICKQGDGIWVAKGIHDFGQRPEKFYKDEQFNYLAQRVKYIEKTKGINGEAQTISDILVTNIKKNNPHHFGHTWLWLKAEEMISPFGIQGIIQLWQNLRVKYQIPEDVIVFAIKDLESSTYSANIAYIFFQNTGREGWETTIPDNIRRGINSRTNIYPRTLYDFISEMGILRKDIPRLFEEEFSFQ